MSTEITRRGFLQIVFATTAAVSAGWSANLLAASEVTKTLPDPARLTIDCSGYIVDASFEYCDVSLPTWRDHLGLIGVEGDDLKKRLAEEYDRFEWVVDGRDDWTVEELEPWLDSELEIDDLSPRNGMRYTPYGPALDLYDALSLQTSDELGLILIEGEMPGNDFTAVQYLGDADALNESLRNHGINLVITEEA